jgi:hypothetical protein
MTMSAELRGTECYVACDVNRKGPLKLLCSPPQAINEAIRASKHAKIAEELFTVARILLTV